MTEDSNRFTHEHAASIDAAIRATTPREAPSGILYNPLFHTLDEPKFASAEPAEVSLRELRQILWELTQSALHGEPPVELAPLDRAVGDAARSGVVPVAMVDYRFEAVTQEAIRRFLAGIRKDGTLDLTGIDRAAILETRRVTLCRPLLDTIPDGKDVVFSFERDWQAANTGVDPAEIIFDAGDGLGPRHLPPASRARVDYSSAGDKRIVCTLRFDDGRETTTVATLHVKALSLPQPNIVAPIEGSHRGVTAYGTMKVYFAPGRLHVVKPLFMWTGFDTGSTMLGSEAPIAHWSATAEDYLADPDIEALLEAGRKAGYDIVIIEFKDTRLAIQANAAMVVFGIRLINAIRTKREPGMILTGSMGGLVARYALLSIEHDERRGGRPHDIAKAIFFDSPFKGAVIPMAVQYALDFFADVNRYARERRDQVLDSDSARQMLVQKYDTGWHQQNEPKPHSDFGAFASECNVLGGWPRKTECYAATSGSGAGSPQQNATGGQLRPQDKLADCYLYGLVGWEATAELRSMPNFPDKDQNGFEISFTSRLFRLNWRARVHRSLPWDTCPGGWYNSVEQFKEKGGWSQSHLNAPRTCFIPTLSALDVEPRAGGGDLYRKPPPASQTPFKEIYTPATNTGHCKLDRDVGNWMRRILGIPPI